MRVLTSLSNRIFVASTALATLSLGLAFAFVNARAGDQAEVELRRGLVEAAALVEQHRATLDETLTRIARLVADLPRLRAAVAEQDPPTVAGPADEFRAQINADLLVVTDPAGRLLASSGAHLTSLPEAAVAKDSFDEVSVLVPDPRGLLQVASVPIQLELETPELMGRLTVGFFLDDETATEFRMLTGSEIAFAADGRIVASSLPVASRAALTGLVDATTATPITIDGVDYLALARPILSRAGGTGGAVTVVLRPRTESLRFLNALRVGLAGTIIGSVLLATLLSYFVARTMTRPLSAVTSAMRDVAATGDLTRKVALQSGAWDDEDARLLASAFNTLTDSVGRFQRESVQKERLSALGRLSTVIAHEIRNPLMIIKASLATLRRERLDPDEAREAVADIDEEATRLNRLVADVLDFAKPLRFELAEARLNDLCRASADAAWAGQAERAVRFELAEGLPPIVTDAELLRRALVNILTNARHAVEAAPANGTDVLLSTSAGDERVVVTVRDHGVGIAKEDLSRIFDPYFTTRRTGTGLGLPITKNIIEGLGGTLAVTSAPGDGTEIRIELPLQMPGAA
jgi:signal transduction histidine kinase